MNSLLTDAEIARLIDETLALQVAEWGSPTLHSALLELQEHRRDVRARGVLPIFVPGQPGEGEMVDALTALVSKDATPDEREQAHNLMRGVLFEVLHLRRQVTRVQMHATNEQELRRRADVERMDAVAERDQLLVALRELGRRKAKEPAVITRTPVPDPPIDQRSPAWREASKRIDEAVDAGRDPDPADVDIAMREKLKSVGFTDPEMLDEMVPPQKKTS